MSRPYIWKSGVAELKGLNRTQNWILVDVQQQEKDDG